MCEALGTGSYLAEACGYAGITTRSYWEWKRRARNGEEPFLSFIQDTTRARASAPTKLLAVVHQAALEGKFQAAEWILERRYSKQWGRKDSVDATVKREAAVREPNLEAFNHDELLAYFRLRAKGATNDAERDVYTKYAEALL